VLTTNKWLNITRKLLSITNTRQNIIVRRLNNTRQVMMKRAVITHIWITDITFTRHIMQKKQQSTMQLNTRLKHNFTNQQG